MSPQLVLADLVIIAVGTTVSPAVVLLLPVFHTIVVTLGFAPSICLVHRVGWGVAENVLLARNDQSENDVGMMG